MTALHRVIVVPREGDLDAITMLGALSSQGLPLGVVLSIFGGRSLPVAVRELTTLDHLADGNLVVILDPQGCTVNQVEEAVALVLAMAANEVTSTSGPTWILKEAPNRPLPTKGAFRLYLLDREAEGGPSGLETLTSLSRVAGGESGIAGEVWEYLSPSELVALVERARRPSAP
jgi:hypothetical protein